MNSLNVNQMLTLLFVCGLTLVAGTSQATIHRVDCTGATGFPTIQMGVDPCMPGDTALVASCPAGPYPPDAWPRDNVRRRR